MKQFFILCITLFAAGTLSAGETTSAAESTMSAGEWTVTYKGYPYKRTACDGPYYKSGATVTLSSGKPVSAEGKEFQGWQYGAKIYQPGASFVMPNKDVELIPKWKGDEALEGVQTPSGRDRIQKILRNWQIVIVRDGMEYDVLGNIIK